MALRLIFTAKQIKCFYVVFLMEKELTLHAVSAFSGILIDITCAKTKEYYFCLNGC